MNRKYMELALKQARQAMALGEVPVGAVVVRGDTVLSAAHNLCETRHDPTAHAELLAIQKASAAAGDFRLTDATLYVTLEPCPMCAGAAANARISEIVFGAADSVKGACGSALNLFHYALPNKPEVFGGVCEQACAALLTDFFRQRRDAAGRSPLD